MDADRREELARAFTAERPRLISLAYRMTGSLADAEDVAQETWIRLQRAGADPQTAPRDLPAWLTTTATRLALDQLRAAGRRRETYVGPWLPSPAWPRRRGGRPRAGRRAGRRAELRAAGRARVAVAGPAGGVHPARHLRRAVRAGRRGARAHPRGGAAAGQPRPRPGGRRGRPGRGGRRHASAGRRGVPRRERRRRPARAREAARPVGGLPRRRRRPRADRPAGRDHARQGGAPRARRPGPGRARTSRSTSGS